VFNIFVIPLLYLHSILPFWFLRFIGSCLFVLVYYIIGYRKKVVFQNLKNSFPEKTEAELYVIQKEFYKHFCDLILETNKLYTISDKTFRKHFSFTENATKTFNSFEEKNQSIILVLGHCGNWEYDFVGYNFYFKQLITGVYHPLSNKNFDKYVFKLRMRFGGNLIPMNGVIRELVKLKSQKTPTTLGLIADQVPPPESAYWTTFLNQDTPVFNGPEKLAKKFNYPVVYVKAIKLKRSHYRLDTKVLTENPTETADGEITEMFLRELENNIKEQPAYWLWSHRRWKHKRPKGMENVKG
jgi:KDO2-lipid IV(A) lauroyltransferase